MQAIQTRYKGYHFRSRLEARWAVFFDTLLGVKWEYEPEGFVLPSGTWYLPDFRLTVPSGFQLWAEIKPLSDRVLGCRDFGAPCEKAVEFAHLLQCAINREETRQQADTFTGLPSDFQALCPTCRLPGADFSFWEGNRAFYYCAYCDQDHPTQPWARFHKGLIDVPEYWWASAQGGFDRACAAAKSARFEHGHSGAS